MSTTAYDTVVIGGGIVGLAAAYQLIQQKPDLKLLLIEKEKEVCQHQSGRNSGVIHSGIYYKPNTFKAKNCREGRQLLIDFCEQFAVPFEICGKIIVATSAAELPELTKLAERARDNGIETVLLEQEQIREREPSCAGIKGLLVKDAGIVDFPRVCQVLKEQILKAGGEIRLETQVQQIKLQDRPQGIVQTNHGDFIGKTILTCAGLQSDRLLKSAGINNRIRIVPFRGEYFELKPEASRLCRHLIYPVPDPQFPFLGVHFTRMIQGGVECGPNAVWSLSREGYKKGSFNMRDTLEAISFQGFLRMGAKHWRMGAKEWFRSISINAFTRSLQKLIPEVRKEDLLPAEAGHRAQALKADGTLVDDFIVEEHGALIHLVNAPSPAATASLSLGKRLASLVLNKLT